MWSWHCNSTLQEYRDCYRPWTILLLFQMAFKEQMHLYCCLGFHLELSLFGWLFFLKKDKPRNRRLVDPVTWQLQYVLLWFQLLWVKCFLFWFLYLKMKIIAWLFKELVLLRLNVYFNEMKLEKLWSLRKQ